MARRPGRSPERCRSSTAERPAHRVAVGLGEPVVVPGQARQVGHERRVDGPGPPHGLADGLHDAAAGAQGKLARGVHGGEDVVRRRPLAVDLERQRLPLTVQPVDAALQADPVDLESVAQPGLGIW